MGGCSTHNIPTEDIILDATTEVQNVVTGTDNPQPIFEHQGHQPKPVELVAAGAPATLPVEPVVDTSMPLTKPYSAVNPVPLATEHASYVAEQNYTEQNYTGFDIAGQAMEYHARQQALLEAEASRRESHMQGTVVTADQMHYGSHIGGHQAAYGDLHAVDIQDTAGVEAMRRRVEAYNKQQEDIALQKAFSGDNFQGAENVVIEPQPAYPEAYQEALPVAQIEQPSMYAQVEQPLPYAHVEQPYSHVEQPAYAQVEQPAPYAQVEQPAPYAQVEQPYAEPLPAAQIEQRPSGYQQTSRHASQVGYGPNYAVPQQAGNAPAEVQPLPTNEQVVAPYGEEVSDNEREASAEPATAEPTKKKKKWGLF